MFRGQARYLSVDTVMQPLRPFELIVNIAFFVLPRRQTYLHLNQAKYVREKCLAHGQNIETMSQH